MIWSPICSTCIIFLSNSDIHASNKFYTYISIMPNTLINEKEIKCSLLCISCFPSTVTACLDLMCQWVHLYLDSTSEDVVNADVNHHGPFYCVCQAVFYVFVFRSKEIFETKKGPYFTVPFFCINFGSIAIVLIFLKILMRYIQ